MSTLNEVAETVEALAAKVRGTIMDGNPEACVRYAEALRDSTTAFCEMLNAVPGSEDEDE